MKRQSIISLIILTLTFVTAKAHSDFWTYAEYGNVKVRILTGFNYEEIKRAFIIAQLAEKLAKEQNYSEPILLDFYHNYIEDCNPVYFISYDKGKKVYNHEIESEEKDFLTTDGIVIRQVSRQFNIVSSLKLLEYSIKNIPSIKSTQKQMDYHQKFCDLKMNSIDTNLIKTQIKMPVSNLVTELLKTKIERPVKNFNFGFSYYVQDNKYQLYFKNGRIITPILSVNYIYDMLEIENYILIFDTDSTFYFVESPLFVDKKIVSSKHVIDNKKSHDAYKPFTNETIIYYYLRNKIKIQ